MKDTFNVHEWNLKRYLAESDSQTFDLSQLSFDQIAPLFPREMKWDGVAFPIGGDVLRRVKREDDFEAWKKDTIEKYGNIKIQLDPSAPWSSHVKILDDKFNKDKEQAIQSKSDSLDSMKGSKD